MAAERHPDTPVPPVEDVIRMVERMTPPDRLRVLEAASRLVHEDVVVRIEPPPTTPSVNDTDTDASYDEWLEIRARLLADVPPDSSLQHILGALRKRGVRVPMTHEEERDFIADAIIEKHSP